MDEFFDLPPIKDDSAEPGTVEYSIIQWCESKLKAGIEFVESQVGYEKISQAIDEIFSFEKTTSASYVPIGVQSLSKTRANIVAKTAEDITAMLTDTRCFWNYTTKNPTYAKQIEYANKDARQWYTDTSADLRFGDAARYYTVAGTSFIHLYYSRRLGHMVVEAEDPRNVFPIDPPSYHSIQDAAGVITRRPRTPAWVKEEYNKTVMPDSGGNVQGKFFGWLKRMVEGPGERNAGPLSKKSKADTPIKGTPTVFVNTMYLRDNRTNKTGKSIFMGPWSEGKPQSPWSYEVKPNMPRYPFHRMIVWGGGVLMYDNTSPYWHKMYPLTKMTLNPWPMSWFGKAPIWDTLPLQHSINTNLRVIDDHAAQVAQPGATADRNVSKAEMNKLNTRAAGYKIRTNMASGKGIVINNPPPLDALIWEVIKWCQEMIPNLAGSVDLSAISNLAQIPSDDTIDTLMKTMTPGIRLRSRILEGVYRDVAKQYLYCIFEFDTTTSRIAKFGPDAVTMEDYDFEPGSMIPDNVPGGDPGDIAVDEIGLNEPRPLHARAEAMLTSVASEIDPSSLLNTAAQQDLMKYFMLAKMGYISVFTIMEKMGIMNFAPPGLHIPSDEIGRLQLQQKLGIGMIANAQGRKASDSAPPSMGSTGNGPTIQTS